MSADAWRVCPKCLSEKRIVDTRVLNPNDELPNTLREDCEQFMNEGGEYECYYRCHCQVCGFSWSFEHKEKAL